MNEWVKVSERRPERCVEVKLLVGGTEKLGILDMDGYTFYAQGEDEVSPDYWKPI